MVIQVDTREHKGEVERVERQLDAMGVKHFRSKLYCGDYQSLDNGRLVIDRKKDLLEIVSNVTTQHQRFRNELVRAQEAGIRIIILCEHGDGIRSMEDVSEWHNPRLDILKWEVVNGKPRRTQAFPNATTGERLAKALKSISRNYEVDFVFCEPSETGEMIVRLLGGETDG